jgi:hypothetical protein
MGWRRGSIMLDIKQHDIAQAEKLPIPIAQAIIDGKPAAAAAGKTLPVISPIDGAVIAALPDCDTPDVDRAVAGARKAFESRRWQGMSRNSESASCWTGPIASARKRACGTGKPRYGDAGRPGGRSRYRLCSRQPALVRRVG